MLTWETKWLRVAPDAESIGGDEVREPRRRNSQSHPMSRVVCSLCPKGEVEPRDTWEMAARSWKMFRRSTLARNRISEAEVEHRGDSPVLVMHDGVTKSIFCSFDSRKKSGLPKLRKGGEDDC